MTPIRYTLSDRDYLDAQRAWQACQFWRAGQLASLIVFVVCVSVAVGVLTRSVLGLLAGLLGTGGYLAWRVGRMPQRSLTKFRLTKGSGLEVTVSFDEDGFRNETESSSVHLRWPFFVAWIEGPTMILLMQSERLFNPLPKRVLAQADQDALIGYLEAAKVPKRQPGRLRWS